MLLTRTSAACNNAQTVMSQGKVAINFVWIGIVIVYNCLFLNAAVLRRGAACAATLGPPRASQLTGQHSPKADLGTASTPRHSARR
jgi:hypothetical protein